MSPVSECNPCTWYPELWLFNGVRYSLEVVYFELFLCCWLPIFHLFINQLVCTQTLNSFDQELSFKKNEQNKTKQGMNAN